MKQIIIARKDLNMSPGKLAAQCCHASLAYFTNIIRNHTSKILDEKFERLPCTYEGRSFPGLSIIDNKGFRLYKRSDLCTWSKQAYDEGKQFFFIKRDPSDPYNLELADESELTYRYIIDSPIETDIFEKWVNGVFTKTICEAKNKTQLLKAITIAEELGLVEGEDFFLIKDACLTELEPEEVDENGQGRVLTCIGFKPLPDDVAEKISKKFQLYRESSEVEKLKEENNRLKAELNAYKTDLD